MTNHTVDKLKLRKFFKSLTQVFARPSVLPDETYRDPGNELSSGHVPHGKRRVLFFNFKIQISFIGGHSPNESVQ